MSDETHLIDPSIHPKETLDWLEDHGYRCVAVYPKREPKDFLPAFGGEPIMSGWEMVGKSGVLFGRKNEPVFLAQVGEVLVWDGICVKVEE